MLELNISAENIVELKKKAFEALGIVDDSTAVVSHSSGSKVSFSTAIIADDEEFKGGPNLAEAPASFAGLHTPPKTPRTRRTKAEIEAERQAKNVGAPAAQVIQNNFEASDEIEETQDNDLNDPLAPTPTASKAGVKAQPKSNVDPEATLEKYPDLLKENKDLLKAVIAVKSMEDAISIVNGFGVREVKHIKVKWIPSYKMACNLALGIQ